MSEASGGLVYIVDDEADVRHGLSLMLKKAGYRVRSYASAEEFLAAPRMEEPACLILDVQLSGVPGPELHARLAGSDQELPVIFLSGQGDIPMSVQAMKRGAVDFLQKPTPEEDLLGAVGLAVERCRQALREKTGLAGLRWRLDLLTPREREVMGKVIAGAMNKTIAAELGLHEQTVKHHRGSVMRKMKADSLAELVLMATQLGLVPTPVKSAD